MDELELVAYTDKYNKHINKSIQEFINENKNLENIPSSFFLVFNKTYNFIIGIVKINKCLNENLFLNEGHILINVISTEEKVDNLAKVVELSIEKCKDFGIGRVLMYCKKDDKLLKTAIKKNGGKVFGKTINTNIIYQKYYISLKKRYANRHKRNNPNSNLKYVVEHFKEEDCDIDVSYYNFKNADLKIVTPKGKVIIDNYYKLLEFYNYNSKVKLSAFYDNNNEIIEWYFDIAKEIGKENEVPYEDDLYLDIVVRPDGTIILLDEKELKSALDKYEITKEEYKMAYDEANKLIANLKDNKEKLKKITEKYLNYFNKKYSN